MKKSLLAAALLVLPIGLSGCDKAAEQPAPKGTASTTSKTGTGEGKVVSVDVAGGAISIDHGPITQIDWPAMTMGFSAKPELLDGIAVGDKVAFEIRDSGEGYEVVSLHKE